MHLSYKGYTTTLKRDPNSRIWYGRVSSIQDMVTFEAKTRMAAEAEFRKSVDAYLSFCRIIDQAPNSPPTARSSISRVAPSQESGVRHQKTRYENVAEF